ncbi:hypothetical protein DFO45_3237 [Azorhizobium sp. AG788]|uniref:hypothetical protein n=1 Tax=Azorhizobium sp. AG788 TaxID=2183897 RepID=UPI00105FD54E|nr:hypothetical protein [Azorhizobium sp. AG788]TDT92487.1 hypothetical protein DFO45_3237 [Azorhizobium sp. AG788]
MFISPAIHPRTHFSPSGQHREDWLADALEVHLAVSPHVIGFRSDERSDEKLRAASAPEGAVVRVAKLPDRILTVVAVPDGDMPSTQLRRTLVKQWGSRNLLVVDEGWLMRQPRRDVMQSLTACKAHRVSRTDWILVEQHLLTNGGSSDLGVCAAHVLRDRDPVIAVLALIAEGRLRIDFSRPLSSSSIIYLPTRRVRGRRVLGA